MYTRAVPSQTLGRRVKSASRAVNTAETLVGGGRRLPCWQKRALVGNVSRLYAICARWSRCPKRRQTLTFAVSRLAA